MHAAPAALVPASASTQPPDPPARAEPSAATAAVAAPPAPVASSSAPLASVPESSSSSASFDSLKSAGNAAFKAGRFDSACSLYVRCISLDPTRWEPYSNRAQASLKLSRWTDALSDAEAGLRLSPANEKLLCSRTVAAAWICCTDSAASVSERQRCFALHRVDPLAHRFWLERVAIAGCGFGFRARRDIPRGAYILSDSPVSSRPFPAGQPRSAEQLRPIVEHLLAHRSLLSALSVAPNQRALAATLPRPASLSCSDADWLDAAAKALSNSFVERAPDASFSASPSASASVSASASAGPLSVFTLHPLSSTLNHSCWPNCAGDGPAVFALRTVSAGAELTLNYSTRLLYEPRAHRQRELRHSFGFDCRCARCEGTEAADAEAALSEGEDQLTQQQRKDIGAQIGSLMRAVDELSSDAGLSAWLSGVQSFLASPLLGAHHRFKLQLLLCIPELCDGPLARLIPRPIVLDLLNRLIRANAALLPELHPARQHAMIQWIRAQAAEGGRAINTAELLKLDPAAQQLVVDKGLLQD